MMTRVTGDTPEGELSSLWRAACDDYQKETGTSINDGALSKISDPEELSRHLDAEENYFRDFRMKKRPLLHLMQTIVAPFEKWGDLIGGVVAATFPPASSITGAMLLLIRSARKVSESFDMITGLFHKLSNFALRLDTYKGVALNEGMKVIVVKVLVNFLRVCSASQQLLKNGSFRSRISKWAKNVFVEDTSITSLMSELEELTNQEHLMVSAQNLNLTHQALQNTMDLLKRDDARSERERLESVKEGLKPMTASNRVFSAISNNCLPGSGSWVEDRVQAWWQSSQPILWLHGGPGMGKSYLAAKIIKDLSQMSSGVTPVIASFFCRKNDVDLRSINNAFRTLAWQLATVSPSFAAHAEEFCLKADPADTYVVWESLLLDYLTKSPSGDAACFVIDGVDEADQEEQEVLFNVLEKTYSADKQPPPLRFVLLSRDSVGSSLKKHSLDWVASLEITKSQTKDDLYRYISETLHKRISLLEGSLDFREEIVDDIRESADGLWEWANLVISSLSRCRTKKQIKKVVKSMPRGISAMLTQELQRLARELSAADDFLSDEILASDESDNEATSIQIQQLKYLLSFVTMAERPFTVNELELMLEVIFEDEILNLQRDLRTTFSSIFLVQQALDRQRNVDEGHAIVTLRHTSFYEFFKRYTPSASDQIHFDPEHADVAFIFVLLHGISPKCTTWIHSITEYAENFLSEHLDRAKLEKAGNLRNRLSSMLKELFIPSPESDPWYIESFDDLYTSRYSSFPSSSITRIANHWFQVGDRHIANRRAQVILDWLSPEMRQVLHETARSSAITSDVCSFSVLFARIAVILASQWLKPDRVKSKDGTPWAIPVMLSIYGDMAETIEDNTAETTLKHPVTCSGSWVTAARLFFRDYSIVKFARLLRLQETPMWHARVAQALLLHDFHNEALHHFQMVFDEQNKGPTLDSHTLSVIHRDMSRVYSYKMLYKEAVEHHQLAQDLGGTDTADVDENARICQLLDLGQKEYRAHMPCQALANLDEAWEIYMRRGDDRDWTLWADFLALFLEMRQNHRLRSVFQLAISYAEEAATESDWLANRIIEPAFGRTDILYNAIHYGLTAEDQKCLKLIGTILGDQEASEWPRRALVEVKYYIGTVLFEKGQTTTGIRSWIEAACMSDPDPIENDPFGIWSPKRWQEPSVAHLVDVCLGHLNLPFCADAPVTLLEEAESGDLCLSISGWLRGRGDIVNARNALRGRVKKAIALLSDDDTMNDWEGYVMLFKTFLIATDSDEDLSGALYLIKVSNGAQASVGSERIGDFEVADPDESFQNAKQVEEELEATWNGFWDYRDIRECARCKLRSEFAADWYFCRSCPLLSLCGRCYRRTRGSGLSRPQNLQHGPTICDAQHQFYYTGQALRESDRFEEGKVALTSSDGQVSSMWIEEWKDRLAEKWGTEDFTFEGGLSAWCTSVLPEVQRERWTTFFKV